MIQLYKDMLADYHQCGPYHQRTAETVTIVTWSGGDPFIETSPYWNPDA